MSRTESADDEITVRDPATNVARQTYEEVRERRGIDDRNDFKTFLEAAADATSMLEITRDLRERREDVRTALSQLRLYEGNAMAFPPSDRDERIEMLRRGEIPDRPGGEE